MSQSFVLPIKQTSGPCVPAITTVRHQFTVLPQPGKRMVTVTTTLEGSEVGSGSIMLPEPDEVLEEPDREVPRRHSVASSIVGAGKWYAFLNMQPPEPSSLYVEGTVILPNPGYEVSLTAQPDACENALTLKLEREQRDGVWIQIPVERSVRYEQSNPPNPETLDEVVIQFPEPRDETVTVDVQKIH